MAKYFCFIIFVRECDGRTPIRICHIVWLLYVFIGLVTFLNSWRFNGMEFTFRISRAKTLGVDRYTFNKYQSFISFFEGQCDVSSLFSAIMVNFIEEDIPRDIWGFLCLKSVFVFAENLCSAKEFQLFLCAIIHCVSKSAENMLTPTPMHHSTTFQVLISSSMMMRSVLVFVCSFLSTHFKFI